MDKDCIHGMLEMSCSLCLGTVAARGSVRSESVGIASIFFDVGTVEVECPYNEDFIADLKSMLPYHARSWDGARRVWVIAGEFWDQAQEIVERYFVLAD